MSALSAMILISGIGNTDAFDGFQEGSGVDVQAIEDRLEVNLLLLGLGIVAVLGQHNQIAVVPTHNIHIPLQAVRCPEPDMITSKGEGGKATSTAEDGLVPVGTYVVTFCHFLNLAANIRLFLLSSK